MSSLRPFKATSASQISKYRRCRRKWWWNKIRGIREPTGAGAAYGTMVHNHMERYFKEGICPPTEAMGEEGRSARDAQRLINSGYYPDDIDPAHVEPKVWLTVPGMLRPVAGRVDVLHPRTNSVLDHKTLKNFKWKKTEQELLNDEQALIYGAVALQHGCTFPIHFSHVYVNTSNGKVEKVTADITEEVLSEGWDGLMDTTQDMVATALIEDPKTVPPNAKACGDYGGCPFRDRCMQLDNIGGTAGFAAKLASTALNQPPKEKTMALNYEEMKARLNKSKAKPPTNGATLPPPVAAPNPAKVQPTTTTAPAVPSVADITRGGGTAINPPDGTPADEVVKPKVTGLKRGEQSYNGKALRSYKKGEMVLIYAEIRQKMLDAGKSKLWAAHSTFSHATVPHKGKRVDIKDDIALMLDIIEGHVTAETAAPEAPVTNPLPPTAPTTGPLPWKVWRHGETPTSEPLAELPNEPTVEMLRASFGPGQYTLNHTTDNWQNVRAKEITVEDSQEDMSRVAAGDATIDEMAPERTLYIGCHPRSRQVWYIDHIVADAQRQVALDYGKDHYTMLDYNTGPKAVAAEVVRAVREGRLELPATLVVDSRHPCAHAVLDVVLPHYQHIVERYG